MARVPQEKHMQGDGQGFYFVVLVGGCLVGFMSANRTEHSKLGCCCSHAKGTNPIQAFKVLDSFGPPNFETYL